MTWYLNSFQPLCRYTTWEMLHQRHPSLPPFIDGSCRREPDLENTRPSITALCRAHLFAPKLRPGNIVVYIAQKGRYGLPVAHFRFVAVLLVVRHFTDHEDAAQWYLDQNLSLPSNCVVMNNDPEEWERTHQQPSPSPDGTLIRNVEEWDAVYRRRKDTTPDFAACEPLFCELRTPPVIADEQLRNIFGGKIPATQNPSKPRQKAQLKDLLRIAGLREEWADAWFERAVEAEI